MNNTTHQPEQTAEKPAGQNTAGEGLYAHLSPRRRTFNLLGLIALLTMAAVGILNVLSHTTLNMAERHGPLVNAGIHLKLETALFHVDFHELMAKDHKFAPEKAWKHLEAARWYGNAMLNGSMSEGKELQPVSDPVLRSAVEGTLRMLDRLDRLAWEIAVDDEARLLGPQADDQKLNNAFDNMFDAVLENASHVEEAIAGEIARSLREYTLLHRGMTALVILLGGAAALVFFRYERRRQVDETQLREGAVRRRTIVESMVDALITINEAGRIESFNPAAERIFGYPAREVIGQNVARLMPEFFQTRPVDPIPDDGEASETGMTVVDREVEGRRKDGSVFPVELSIAEMHIGDQLLFSGILRDITERKLSEDALESAHNALELRVGQLVEREREIRSFYHTLSHELKTPLTAAREFTLIMRDEIAGSVTDEQREYLGDIEESCDQMRVIIDDLVDSARLDTGKLALNLSPCSVARLVDRSITSVQLPADAKGVRLRGEVVPFLPEIEADCTRVVQILTNLINNALRYTDKGGDVLVEASRPLGSPGFVRFSVRDTGCGMEQEQAQHVFDRFYQVDEGGYTHQGFGMGLHVCKELVRLHGGEIEVKSTPGEGTEFSFTLPVHREVEKPVEAA